MLKGSTTTFVFTFLIFISSLFSQNAENAALTQNQQAADLPEWVTLMQCPNSSLPEIIEKYELFYEQNAFYKNRYTQQYKRLLKKHSRIKYNPSLSIDEREQIDKKYLATRKNTLVKTGLEWQAIGPKDLDFEAAVSGSTPGTAHVYALSFCQGLEQHILAGTATAGLWKSSNNAISWELISQDLPVNEVKAMSYEPNNPSTIYFSANNTLYKTLNGGLNWEIIGGTTLQNVSYIANKILLHNSETQTILLATSIGLYKSIDGGENFILCQSGNFQDIEFHPTNPEIVYAVAQSGNRTWFYRSNDFGSTFNVFENGYPQPSSNDEQKRTTIAVTPAEPDAVFALAVGQMNGGEGLVGIYKSDDQGTNWNRKCCGDTDGGEPSNNNPNIMEWDCSGQNPGGQYYYDLALGVSPQNAQQILTGGINLWVSQDGGSTISCHSDFIYRHNPDTYVHADIHDIHYVNGKVWVASDGGIFMSSDNLQTFQKKMNGLHGTDFRGFDVGFYNDQIMVGGTYHNGTLLKENNVYNNEWVSTRSGDNSTAFINTGENSIIYDQSSMRELTGDRNKAPHNINLARKPNTSYTIGASSEIVFDPFNYMTIYVGSNGSLYKSANNGVTFELVKTFGNGKVTAIEKSIRIPGLMYVVYYPSFSAPKKLMRTMNNGASWEEVTPPSSLYDNKDTWVAFDIAVGSHSPFDIWLARVPQTTDNLSLDGAMIFYSSDAGDSWTNITSAELDGEYPTNIIHQDGTNKGVYLGTRRGVYYRSQSMQNWNLLSNGLPASTFSTKLVTQYSTGKIINATQRGIYSMDFVENGTPISIPMVDKRYSDCLRDTFYFMDRSPVGIDAERIWTFTGADITSSTEAFPKVTYSKPGQYPVKLQVSENGSSSTYESFNFVEVIDGCKLDSVVGSSLVTGNDSYARIPAYKRAFSEFTLSAWIKRYGIIYNEAGVIMHRDGPIGTGLLLDEDGYLSYLWDEYDNTYSEELFVPYNQWTHVAMTVNTEGVTLYVNGVPSHDSRNVEPAELMEHFVVGSDAFAISNYMSGFIDEISIYERALDQEEIQLCMNLTHMSPPDGLISYFQANNSSGKLTDRVGFSHAYMMANASRMESKAPVASGCAEMHVIDMPGTYDFDCAGVRMTFNDGDVLPMAPVSVVRMNELPDLPNPEGTKLSESYWVFNNHGDNGVISAPSSVEFTGFGPIDSIYKNMPEIYKMYKVPASWEYGWGSATDSADSINIEGESKLIYDVAESLTSMGKVMFAEEGLPSLAFAQIDLELDHGESGRKLSWTGLEGEWDYDVLVSVDGEQWNVIERVGSTYPENPNKIYEFTDISPLNGRIYYKIVAKNDLLQTVESELVTTIILQNPKIHFYPNIAPPGTDITFQWNDEFLLKIFIYDVQGSLMKNAILHNSKEQIMLDIPVGTYVVQCESDNEIFQGQLIIQ